jgi:CRISPR/Cas system-associated exonuclease Cas4 (RecB family)
LKKFLEQTAEAFIERFGTNNSRHVVIVPNKRSEIFLKNYLKELTSATLWLPEFYTIDEFISKTSGLINLDPVLVYFELYEIHKELRKEDAMPLEDFLSWAPIMLADFNDIDVQLQDARHVFRHLSEAKAIEKWNPDGSPLTKVEQDYLDFYRSLFAYYSELKNRLQSKGAGFKGMIYRYLQENKTLLSTAWGNISFSLVGFNALSKSELDIFGYVKDNFDTTIYLDADKHYLDLQRPDKNDGAGRFLSEIISEWKLTDIKWIGNLLETHKNKLEVFAVAKQIGQVKFAGKLLEKWYDENKAVSGEIDTAIVLADENLLIPLLHSLPELEDGNNQIPFNITMGYPLTNTAFSRFVLQWLSFIIRFSDKQNDPKFPVNDLIRLISNPVITLLLNKTNKNFRSILVNELLKTGKVYLSTGELNSLIPESVKEQLNSLFNLLLIRTEKAEVFMEALKKMLLLVKEMTEKEEDIRFPLLAEQLNKTYAVIQQTSIMLKQQNGMTLKALQKILLQLLRRGEISLKGEPLEGIQIMGMLETRNLDFKNLIILSANEGILPKTGLMESFIPFDIRHNYHLPLPKEQNDISAYYFFRLLQRAERVALIYNSDSDKFGGGEKSRFILQTEFELPHLFRDPGSFEKIVHTSIPANQTEDEISITKTAEVIKGIRRKADTGFSASSLIVYRNCPLKFYFSEILGLRDLDKIEPDIEFNVFGNAIHRVLEKIYSHFIGKNIDPEKIKSFIPEVGKLLDKELAEIYKGGNTKTGKNHLIYEVAKKYIDQFLKYEAGKSSSSGIRIIGLEERISKTTKLGNYEVTLKGFLDRIERTETGDIRIVDYKTGKVEPKDLKLNDKTAEAEQLADRKKEKLFQLLFYAHLYRLHTGNNISPRLGIYSLRMLSSYGLMETSLPNGDDFFETYLTGLIEEIFDPSVKFSQTEDDRICHYCDFKDICNR